MAATVVIEKLAGWSDQDRADYAAHCSDVPLLSIQNDEELARALEKINELIDAPSLSVGSEGYLDALTDLVGVYEAKTVHFPKVGGVEVLRFLMEEHGLQQQDLVKVFGSKSTVSEVLNGKRRLALQHIARLSEYFGVPSDVFMDTPLKISGQVATAEAPTGDAAGGSGTATVTSKPKRRSRRTSRSAVRAGRWRSR